MKNFTASTKKEWGVELLSVDELYYDEGADPDGQRPRLEHAEAKLH